MPTPYLTKGSEFAHDLLRAPWNAGNLLSGNVGLVMRFRPGFSAFIYAFMCVAFWHNQADARLTYLAQKTDQGLPFLIISGDFEASDDVLEMHKAVHESGATVVFFNSTGGNVVKAMEIGRAIRALKLSTMQIRGADCASACSLAFMGGVTRYAQPGSIGVHKSSFADTTGMTVEGAVAAVQQLTAKVITYMSEMGVDPSILELALQYDSSDIRFLSGSEMEKYRLASSVTDGGSTGGYPTTPLANTPPLGSSNTAPSVAQLDADKGAYRTPDLDIPTPKSGRVQHPKGVVELKVGPEVGTKSIATIPNGTKVTIVGDTEKWFQVRSAGKTGYMHHSWVWIAEYEAASYGRKFVQVKSFDNLPETRAYIKQSSLPLSAYLASNGWFAVTIDNAFSDHEMAVDIMKAMKAKGAIPDDSVVTFGNAFVRKVCCGN